MEQDISALLAAADARGQRLSPAQAKAVLDSGTACTVLDVRTPEEFSGGHVPGAQNLPVDRIDDIAAVTADKECLLLVYCRSGARSARAATRLRQLGYARVYDFGGLLAWPYVLER